jgi:hypothetical protein
MSFFFGEARDLVDQELLSLYRREVTEVQFHRRTRSDSVRC